jgi:hypothetical protein
VPLRSKDRCNGGFCRWSEETQSCTGTTYCRDYSTADADCKALPFCEWSPPECRGPVLECDPILRQEDCAMVEGCEWR